MVKVIIFIIGVMMVLLILVFAGCGKPPIFYPPIALTPAPVTLLPSPSPIASVGTMTPTWTSTPFQPTSTPVPPSPTNTPVPTNTFTFTPTPLITVIASVTPCQTYGRFGETNFASGAITFTLLNTGTVFQSYTVSQPSKLLNAYVSCISASPGATVQFGVYSDSGGFPSSLIFSDSVKPAYGYTNWMQAPFGGISLSPGTYWIAFSTVSGTVAMQLASGSSAHMTTIPQIMPAVFPVGSAKPNPPAVAGQGYMGGYLSTCF